MEVLCNILKRMNLKQQQHQKKKKKKKILSLNELI
jgi:hypothetical protein